MDWFTNMYSPITERTDISGIYAAYDRFNYNVAMQSVIGMGPVYNFSKGQTNQTTYNGNIFGGSIFGSDNIINFGGQNMSNPIFSPLGQTYNFTGSGVNGVTRTNNSTPVSTPTTSSPPAVTPVTQSSKAFSQKIADNAQKYLGFNEADGSFRRFSNDKEWCADFVTYVVRETYKSQGLNPPSGFGSWRCENLKKWAIKNNKFLFTAGKANKQDIIKSHVKPGDIVIMRENGASHTGIVKSVDRKTGDYVTIEGNVKTQKGIDMVVSVNHSPYESDVSGFIQLV